MIGMALRKRYTRMAWMVGVFLLLCAAPVLAQGECRDPLVQPFAPDSIWNMPIGSNAVYVPAEIAPASRWGVTADEELIILTPDAPLRPIYEHDAGWDVNRLRCESRTGELLFEGVPIPLEFWTDPGYLGGTPNHGAAILLADGESILQTQPLHICDDGAAVSQYLWETISIYGDGTIGAHGGSNLSSIGGSLRVGELVPGGAIRHALKLNLYGELYYYYDANDPDGMPGYRWPASWADSVAAETYGGTNYALQMGALLALPPTFDMDTLQTEPARMMAEALRDYGTYIVDDAAWDVYGWSTEWGPGGRVLDEFRQAWGWEFEVEVNATCSDRSSECLWAQDMAAMVTALHVVDNNAADAMGGGGKPLAPPAPPLCGSG
jgi:hypothetical protein